MSAASFLHSSFLQAVNAVMFWLVRAEKVPQASEHLCPAKLQTRCDICSACQSICPRSFPFYCGFFNTTQTTKLSELRLVSPDRVATSKQQTNKQTNKQNKQTFKNKCKHVHCPSHRRKTHPLTPPSPLPLCPPPPHPTPHTRRSMRTSCPYTVVRT